MKKSKKKDKYLISILLNAKTENVEEWWIMKHLVLLIPGVKEEMFIATHVGNVFDMKEKWQIEEENSRNPKFETVNQI